jgi:hypothetical protein
VFDRLELADLYQINSLKSACGQLIRQNLSKVKTDAKWIQLKIASPQLALSILEEFADESVNKKQDIQQNYPYYAPIQTQQYTQHPHPPQPNYYSPQPTPQPHPPQPMRYHLMQQQPFPH